MNGNQHFGANDSHKESTDKAKTIQATMSLSQKVRLLARRSNSTLAAIASMLCGVLVDTMISTSISDRERACAACLSGFMSDDELKEIRAWYLIELGRVCVAHDSPCQLTHYGQELRYLGRLLEHANATSKFEISGLP